MMSPSPTPKSRTSDLAIFGGNPTFRKSLHVGSPNIGDRSAILASMESILERRWFTNHGSMEREFEARLKEVVGTRHCIPVCNATIGLEVAIRALGLSGEVIVPAFTFVATAHALSWLGIKPVFADVELGTHNISPREVEKLITERTTGIIGVHLWGRPCETDALEAIAQEHGLSLLFDAAHAFGCARSGRPIGGFGRCEVFSFHATKFLNSFEGGAVATDDDDLAAKIRLMSNFGFSGYDQVESVGTNAKMTEVCAAMGLASLTSMDRILAVNRANQQLYRRHLNLHPGIRILDHSEVDEHNYHYVILEIDRDGGMLSRDELLRILHAEGILARRYFYPGLHRMAPYNSSAPVRPLPNTERLAERVLVLPNGESVTENEIEAICGIILFAIRNAPEVLSRLNA